MASPIAREPTQWAANRSESNHPTLERIHTHFRRNGGPYAGLHLFLEAPVSGMTNPMDP